MKIYVATSWKNEHQPAIVKRFRDEGHEVYDFRNPLPGQHGFSWKETSAVPPERWTVDEFNAALETEPAKRGFGLDMAALIWCDVCVCVLPSGKDAHLEVGWAAGVGWASGGEKKTAVLLLDRCVVEKQVTGVPCYPNGLPNGSPREPLPAFLVEVWNQRGRPEYYQDATNPYRGVREEEVVTRIERGWEPGLMYKMCDLVTGDVERVSGWLRALDLFAAEKLKARRHAASLDPETGL